MINSKLGLTKVVGTAALVLLVLVGWFFVLSPRMAKAGEINEQTQSVEMTNNKLSKDLEDLKAKAAKIEEKRGQAQALAARFPATAELPSLFQQITKAATDAGIPAEKVSALTPGVPVLAGDPAAAAAAGGQEGTALPGEGAATATVAAMEVAITATADHATMTQFLANLELMPRSYLISAVTVTPGGDEGNGQYTVTITGQMFVHAEVADPSEAGENKEQASEGATGDGSAPTPVTELPAGDDPQTPQVESSPEPAATEDADEEATETVTTDGMVQESTVETDG